LNIITIFLKTAKERAERSLVMNMVLSIHFI